MLAADWLARKDLAVAPPGCGNKSQEFKSALQQPRGASEAAPISTKLARLHLGDVLRGDHDV